MFKTKDNYIDDEFLSAYNSRRQIVHDYFSYYYSDKTLHNFTKFNRYDLQEISSFMAEAFDVKYSTNVSHRILSVFIKVYYHYVNKQPYVLLHFIPKSNNSISKLAGNNKNILKYRHGNFSYFPYATFFELKPLLYEERLKYEGRRYLIYTSYVKHKYFKKLKYFIDYIVSN